MSATNDLFGIGAAEHQMKIEKVLKDISALERGEFNYYVPPTYINVVKDWITPAQKRTL